MLSKIADSACKSRHDLPPKILEANLDYLLQRSKAKKGRTKYHDLVASVKERCLVYGLIEQEWTSALRQLHALVQPLDDIVGELPQLGHRQKFGRSDQPGKTRNRW
jgi:hypothetical protein